MVDWGSCMTPQISVTASSCSSRRSRIRHRTGSPRTEILSKIRDGALSGVLINPSIRMKGYIAIYGLSRGGSGEIEVDQTLVLDFELVAPAVDLQIELAGDAVGHRLGFENLL